MCIHKDYIITHKRLGLPGTIGQVTDLKQEMRIYEWTLVPPRRVACDNNTQLVPVASLATCESSRTWSEVDL